MKVWLQRRVVISFSLLALCCLTQSLMSQVDRFQPKQGGTTELWRLTHDPKLRAWANYHNQNCWSPDGRYVCYTVYEPYDLSPTPVVFIFDLHADEEIRVGEGMHPRWGKANNWLFYVSRTDRRDEVDILWWDLVNKKTQRIASGVPNIGNTDFQDRWLFGYVQRGPGNNRTRESFRIPIRPNSRPELLEGLGGFQWIANPAHPIIFSRHDHGDPNATDQPFAPTRFWCDLDGRNVVVGSPMIQRCHQSWSGDGEYHLHGSTPVAGRRWDEPFPSNLHILSNIGVGDVSPNGRSGRWICGGSNVGPLQLIDLRSGDGYTYLGAAASFIHDDDRFGYSYGSALEDNDSKGSADGTKICFVSNYDLKTGPLTVTRAVAVGDVDRILVASTVGFPEKGRLSVGNEVIGYGSKTSNSFDDLSRRMYNTTATNLEYLSDEVRVEYESRESDEAFVAKRGLNILRKLEALYSKVPPDIGKGRKITSFEARFIPPENRAGLSPTSRFLQSDFPGYKDSPLMWQARTDVYVAVVRLPDQPHLREIAGVIELIPGENHWETFGYRLMKDGAGVTNRILRPGSSYDVKEPGIYTAVAVEWSGLKSKASTPLHIDRPLKLLVRPDKPADFSWTIDRWLAAGREVSAEHAMKAESAVKETVHRLEGTIDREWYENGEIVLRHDLNSQGLGTRRLFYKDGRLIRREYWSREEEHVSEERFDSQGYITESIIFRTQGGERREHAHTWFKEGMPIRHTGNNLRHTSPSGPGVYEKQGEQWLKVE